MTPETNAALRSQLQRIIELLSVPVLGDENPTRSLLARLRALAPEDEAAPLAERIVVGRIAIDLAGHEVTSAGRRVHLTHREFALLSFLAQRAGRACTREQIVAHVWGDRTLASSRTVDIHVYRLRTKLGEPFAELVETLRHVGYRLQVEARVPACDSTNDVQRSDTQERVSQREPVSVLSRAYESAHAAPRRVGVA